MKKYKVLKAVEQRSWEIGDIVNMDDVSASKLLEHNIVEAYEGDEPNKHVAITVDPVKLSATANNI